MRWYVGYFGRWYMTGFMKTVSNNLPNHIFHFNLTTPCKRERKYRKDSNKKKTYEWRENDLLRRLLIRWREKKNAWLGREFHKSRLLYIRCERVGLSSRSRVCFFSLFFLLVLIFFLWFAMWSNLWLRFLPAIGESFSWLPSWCEFIVERATSTTPSTPRPILQMESLGEWSWLVSFPRVSLSLRSLLCVACFDGGL